MSLKFAFRELKIAANKSVRVHDVASFFMLVSNTGSQKIQISIDDDPFSDCPVGYEYQEKKEDDFYSHIDFRNPNAAEVTIEYVMSSGLVRSSPSITGPFSVVDIANEIETPVPIQLNAGNSYTNTIAADTQQKGLMIENTGDNECWYGASAATVDPATKRGCRLAVGAKEILPITCAIVFKSADLDCTISYMRLKKT